MSESGTQEPLRLSDELVLDLQKAIMAHDARAEDAGVTVQYCAAVIGYLLAQQAFSREEKQQLLQQLSAFAEHVWQDCERDEQQAQQQDAEGKWRPGDS